MSQALARLYYTYVILKALYHSNLHLRNEAEIMGVNDVVRRNHGTKNPNGSSNIYYEYLKTSNQIKASQRAHGSTWKTFSYTVGFDSAMCLQVKMRYVTSTSSTNLYLRGTQGNV
eukprot:3181538-Ditylum_brightwellii.AAC.1